MDQIALLKRARLSDDMRKNCAKNLKLFRNAIDVLSDFKAISNNVFQSLGHESSSVLIPKQTVASD